MINQDRHFADRLIEWQLAHGRHDLPWQRSKDPYLVWLSEIMLQQTQVATVLPYFARFVARFPSLGDLARAALGEVMAVWSGLGYYARARNLHACARQIEAEHGGAFPRTPEAIATLPGIGRSTANAIAAFCHGSRVPILDGNVKRVLCRHFGVEGFPGAAAVEKALWQLAASLLPKTRVAVYLQAQMDLGALVCTRSKPRCAACPVCSSCLAFGEDRIASLPRKRQPKALPEREQRLLLLVDRQRVLLSARPPAGIWGGLHSLPELPEGAEPSVYAREVLGCEAKAWQALPPLNHSFTHFHLKLLPLLGAVKQLPRSAERTGECWLGAEGLGAAALPAPIRRLLESFFRISPAPGAAPEPDTRAESGRRAIR